MRRRTLILATLAILAIAATAALTTSRATYTTGSQSKVVATADTASNWLYLLSDESDSDTTPLPLPVYAHKRLINGGVGDFCATGQDDGLAVDMGGFPDKNKNYTFNCVFTIKAPTAFPDASVSSVTVTVTRQADPATGEQPITSALLNTVGSAGGSTSLTVAAGQKRQLNITIGQKKRFSLGTTYYPTVTLTLTLNGSGSYPAGYYVYTEPVAVTDVGGS